MSLQNSLRKQGLKRKLWSHIVLGEFHVAKQSKKTRIETFCMRRQHILPFFIIAKQSKKTRIETRRGQRVHKSARIVLQNSLRKQGLKRSIPFRG